MIIDFHAHLGSDKDGKSQSLSGLEKLMKENGTDFAVVFPFDEKDSLEKTSRALLVYSESNEQLIPFLRFDPNTTTEESLGKLLGYKFRGVKLHPRSQNFDPTDRKYFSLYKLIEERKLPLLFHTRKESTPYSDPDRIIELAQYFPRLIIILGHFGAYSRNVIEKMKAYKNVYLEISGPYSSSERIEAVAKEIGYERILFGSDTPYFNPRDEARKVYETKLPDEAKKAILGGNAARLLGLKVPVAA